MNEFYFEDVGELYNRIKPALRSKVKELRLEKKTYIKEEDIFIYLSENKWNKQKGLTLADMVDDILYLDNEVIDNYVAKKIIDHRIKEMDD